MGDIQKGAELFLPIPTLPNSLDFFLYLLFPNSFPYYFSALLHSKGLMFLHTALKAKIKEFSVEFFRQKACWREIN